MAQPENKSLTKVINEKWKKTKPKILIQRNIFVKSVCIYFLLTQTDKSFIFYRIDKSNKKLPQSSKDNKYSFQLANKISKIKKPHRHVGLHHFESVWHNPDSVTNEEDDNNANRNFCQNNLPVSKTDNRIFKTFGTLSIFEGLNLAFLLLVDLRFRKRLTKNRLLICQSCIFIA